MSVQAIAYDGSTAETSSNVACVDWTIYEAGSSSPSRDYVIDGNFPEGTVVGASNYCRSPDEDSTSWCFTDDIGAWGYCNVPECPGKVSIKSS